MGLDVDSAFSQAEEYRPKPTIVQADGIPLIDLSPLHLPNSGESEAFSDLVSQVGSACRDWGFFQVINHGVLPEVRQKVEALAAEFFGLPLEEKRKVRRDEVNPLGYYDTELTKNVRDWKEVFDFVVNSPTVIPASHLPDNHELQTVNNQWPEYPPELRYVNFYKEDLSSELMLSEKKYRSISRVSLYARKTNQ